jgi:hypothetical protein
MAFFHYNLIAETSNFGIGAVLLSCLIYDLQKGSCWDLNPGAILTEVFMIFEVFSEIAEIDNDIPISYAFLLAIYWHFRISVNARETNFTCGCNDPQ